jgi:phage shock protein E
MNAQALLQDYWPFLLLAAWFGYKWWNARRVAAMLPELRRAGASLIDVRSPGEFAQANAPGTVNIPLQDLGSRLREIPKTSPVVVGCASGTRSGMARMMLKRNGYARVYNIGTWSNFLK